MTETNSEFTIIRTYEDDRDLLTQIKAEIPDGGGGTNVVSQYDYAYDAIGLRSSVVNSGTAFGTNAEHNIWGYNDRGELTSSYRYVGSNPWHLRVGPHDLFLNRGFTTKTGLLDGLTFDFRACFRLLTIPEAEPGHAS